MSVSYVALGKENKKINKNLCKWLAIWHSQKRVRLFGPAARTPGQTPAVSSIHSSCKKRRSRRRWTDPLRPAAVPFGSGSWRWPVLLAASSGQRRRLLSSGVAWVWRWGLSALGAPCFPCTEAASNHQRRCHGTTIWLGLTASSLFFLVCCRSYYI